MGSRRSFIAGSMASAATLLLGARSAKAQQLEKVSFRFNWAWVGNYSPVVLGRERGYFKELGIDLDVAQGKGSGATARQVGSKNDMFAWADTGAVMVARAQGIPIVEVMTLARSNLGVLWISGRGLEVKTARDLIGKKVSATPGDGNSQIWPAVLAANNMKANDVEMVYLDGTASLAALREGRVDAAFGGSSDQPVTLRANGFDAKCVTYAELGVPTLGSGVITHVDTLKERPDLVQKIVKGVQRSWEAALKEPDAAVNALMKISTTPLNIKVVRDSLHVFQGLATNTSPTGYMNPTDMEKTLDIMKRYAGVKTDLPATAFYTNQFIKAT
ncbi:ABC transporter substrate-binding protein [Paraburkholderia sp. Ac-20336]|uniref:ABC transporter substrate-binding protein n=1 Tax=Paraburkholderia sp. Ac-20336 TaxID=2703886 RepID=UPI001982340F|nr:ABC transporter substrate-binding protein [Paraburkholderia sp. Ac-20336]MBN3801924.1 ABC transporter substrate-binding protein [Paraburkholderia sp. Ac-20336]